MRRLLIAFAVTALCLGGPTCLVAQFQIGSRAANLVVGGRLHAQYQASSIDLADNDFFVRRARISVDLEFNDFFSGKLLTDFKDDKATLLDAYVQLDFDAAFRFSAGQFKRAFDLFGLVSSTDLSVIERTGDVGGYSECPGVGGVCSYSRLMEELDFSDRDTGIRAEGSSGALSYQVTLTNGRGVGTRDENDGKSLAGRISYAATDNVLLSGNVGLRDYLDTFDGTQRALALGADVQVGDWRDGFLLQASVVGGDNWQLLDISTDDPAPFLAFQGIASYYHPLQNDRFVAVEPLARVSIADANRDFDEDAGTLLTPGVMFYLMGKNKLGANLDYYIPQGGDAVYSLKLQVFLYF